MDILDQRYARNIMYSQFGEQGQQSLFAARVAVVGSGGLGGFLLQQIVAAGVGNVKIIDFDTISRSNLNRQILFSEQQIGLQKSLMAKERLEQLNGDVAIEVSTEKVTNQNCNTILVGSDIVVDCSDNFEVRYLLDEWCFEHGIPLVHGSVEGMQGSVTTFLRGKTARYTDLYGENLSTKGAVGVLSPVVGAVASFQAAEVIKLATAIGEPLFNKMVVIDMLNNSVQTFDL